MSYGNFLVKIDLAVKKEVRRCDLAQIGFDILRWEYSCR
jgi:hypothetical protein